MPVLATDPHRHKGKPVGNGHCVAFVVECTDLGPSTTWRRGDPVVGSGAAPLTAIATFDPNGRYASRTDGSSHAAILLAEHSDGSITVLDQWLGQPVHERIIRNRAGSGDAANDASRFYVVEIA
jgi:hypothetical protein